MKIDNTWQPTLTGDHFHLRPLREDDFDLLYRAASDPLIWEQHPDFERYKPEKFKKYFDSGLKSRGAFLISDHETGDVVGSSRYANYFDDDSSVEIGYTFLTRKYWGGSFNRELKGLMLRHAFQFAKKAYFIVGRNNQRSRRAMEKIGGVLIPDTTGLPVHGDLSQAVVFCIERKDFDPQDKKWSFLGGGDV